MDVNGVAKGMKQILELRGINTSTLTGPYMRIILANHTDFSNEKTVVEHFLLDRGHFVRFIPKFHCELNPIERVWTILGRPGIMRWLTEKVIMLVMRLNRR